MVSMFMLLTRVVLVTSISLSDYGRSGTPATLCNSAGMCV